MCPAKNQKNKNKKKAKTKNLKLTEFAEFADEPECEVVYGDYCSAKRWTLLYFFMYVLPDWSLESSSYQDAWRNSHNI